jgi:hypothetical protein
MKEGEQGGVFFRSIQATTNTPLSPLFQMGGTIRKIRFADRQPLFPFLAERILLLIIVSNVPTVQKNRRI